MASFVAEQKRIQRPSQPQNPYTTWFSASQPTPSCVNTHDECATHILSSFICNIRLVLLPFNSYLCILNALHLMCIFNWSHLSQGTLEFFAIVYESGMSESAWCTNCNYERMYWANEPLIKWHIVIELSMDIYLDPTFINHPFDERSAFWSDFRKTDGCSIKSIVIRKFSIVIWNTN